MDEKKIREAIEKENKTIDVLKKIIASNKDGSMREWANDMMEYCETVIEALEKQLPKKPLEVKNSPIPSEKMYYCPICSGRFVNRGVIGYCYHCGQLLDWSEQS